MVRVIVFVIALKSQYNGFTEHFNWCCKYCNVKYMALNPSQNSSFCLQHCCFESMLVFTNRYSTSVIQHCTFTSQHPYFTFNVLRLHTTFLCMLLCSDFLLVQIHFYDIVIILDYRTTYCGSSCL